MIMMMTMEITLTDINVDDITTNNHNNYNNIDNNSMTTMILIKRYGKIHWLVANLPPRTESCVTWFDASNFLFCYIHPLLTTLPLLTLSKWNAQLAKQNADTAD